ncbi:hypothetical protein ACLOAU_14515 [Niabella sp. CJ426]|uniref:hypothetical protein n=1 Tax=Niabella sp. CJ426 TaxID=3393740 RepID=UPI003CFBD0B6
MDLQKLKDRLLVVTQRLEKIEGTKYYTDKVANSFYLGMVGGSGRNTTRLNRRRESELDKTIQNAKIWCELYNESNRLKAQIADIENNGPQKRAELAKARNEMLVKYWASLTVGDTVYLWTGNEVTITKKNRKSIVTDNCSWSASEIIGADAAKLIK